MSLIARLIDDRRSCRQVGFRLGWPPSVARSFRERRDGAEGIVTLNKAIRLRQSVDSVEDCLAQRTLRPFSLERSSKRRLHPMVGGTIDPMQSADLIRGQPYRSALVDGSLASHCEGKVVDVERF